MKLFEKILVVVVTILTSVVSFFLIRTLSQVDESIANATNSIQDLNKTVGGVVIEMSYQRKELDLHTIQIRDLQTSKADKKIIRVEN
jgi:uncharacterized protein YoxC